MEPTNVERAALLVVLEHLVRNHVYNNGARINYPLSGSESIKFHGNEVPDPHDIDAEFVQQARYEFGANDLYIYEALNEVLDYLEDHTDSSFEWLAEDLLEKYEEEGTL